MAFITIVETDEAFDWQPTDDESGRKLDSVFSLRVIPDDVDESIRKKNTLPVRQPRGPMQRELNQPKYITALIDYAIVGWKEIRSAETGAELPCTTALKARLPEKWKAEILRLCSGKEAGDVVAAAEQEKKVSKTI